MKTTETSPSILVLGLNPAWQKWGLLPELQPGAVLRLQSLQAFASGKGINCARVLRLLGEQPLLVQMAGGAAGERLRGELDSEGMLHFTQAIAEETRTCWTFREAQGRTTEIIEPSPAVCSDEIDALIATLAPLTPAIRSVAICGTFPRGVQAADLATLDFGSVKLYLDGCRDVEVFLERGVHLLKINADELAQLVPSPSRGESARMVFDRWNPVALVVTQGSGAVHLYTRTQNWSIQPPALDRVVNPIGAGDSFLAGWIAAESAGRDLLACLCAGTAVASARCCAERPQDIDVELARSWIPNLLAAVHEDKYE